MESAKKAVEAGRADQELGPAPTSVAAVTGKKVAMILCTAAAEGCAAGGRAVTEAGDSLGWDVEVVDGQGTPANQNAAMLQAISNGAQGIILAAIDGASVQEALAVAHEKDIPVVAVSGAVEEGTGDDQVFSSLSLDSVRQLTLTGQWIIADSDGKATVGIVQTPDVQAYREYAPALKSTLDKCGGCTQYAVEYAFATADQDIPLRIQTLLSSHPDIDYLYVDYAGAAQAAVSAVAQSGRDIKVVEPDCFASTLALVKDGSVSACVSSTLDQLAWRAADQLNRAFAGEAPTDVGPEQYKLFDDASTVPDSWSGDGDYKAFYKKVWGVS